MATPRVGIIGAGQLGRMMAIAGYPLGIDFLFVDSDFSLLLHRPGKQFIQQGGQVRGAVPNFVRHF